MCTPLRLIGGLSAHGLLLVRVENNNSGKREKKGGSSPREKLPYSDDTTARAKFEVRKGEAD